MGSVDHQLIGLAALGCQFGEDAVEHAKAAPPDEAVVDGLVRAMPSWRIAPAQPVPDHEDDAAHDPPIIGPGNAVRQREIELVRRICPSLNNQTSENTSASSALQLGPEACEAQSSLRSQHKRFNGASAWVIRAAMVVERV